MTTHRRAAPAPPVAHRPLVPLALILASVITGTGITACRGGDRSGATADTIVAQSPTGRGGAPIYTITPPTDSPASGGQIGGGGGGDTTTTRPTFPEPALVLTADSAAGLRLYRSTGSCAPCHGARGEGVPGLGAPLNDSSWVGGDGSLSHLYRVISEGVPAPPTTRTPMPAQQLMHSPREIFALAAYVYSISRQGATIRDSTSRATDAPPIARLFGDTLRRQSPN